MLIFSCGKTTIFGKIYHFFSFSSISLAGKYNFSRKHRRLRQLVRDDHCKSFRSNNLGFQPLRAQPLRAQPLRAEWPEVIRWAKGVVAISITHLFATRLDEAAATLRAALAIKPEDSIYRMLETIVEEIQAGDRSQPKRLRNLTGESSPMEAE